MGISNIVWYTVHDLTLSSYPSLPVQGCECEFGITLGDGRVDICGNTCFMFDYVLTLMWKGSTHLILAQNFPTCFQHFLPPDTCAYVSQIMWF